MGKLLDSKALKESRLHGDDPAKGEAPNMCPSNLCRMFAMVLCLCGCLHLILDYKCDDIFQA